MKKSTLISLIALLNGEPITEPDTIQAELEAELNKGTARKQANAEAYEAIHDVIVDNLGDTPCTVSELWDVIKDKVPDGTTKGRVQYALTHLWQDEIVKVEGKPNGYRKA